MTEKIRKPIGKRKKLPQFTIMNVIEGQAGLENYSSLFFYSLTIDNILNIIVCLNILFSPPSFLFIFFIIASSCALFMSSVNDDLM